MVVFVLNAALVGMVLTPAQASSSSSPRGDVEITRQENHAFDIAQ